MNSTAQTALMVHFQAGSKSAGREVTTPSFFHGRWSMQEFQQQMWGMVTDYKNSVFINPLTILYIHYFTFTKYQNMGDNSDIINPNLSNPMPSIEGIIGLQNFRLPVAEVTSSGDTTIIICSFPQYQITAEKRNELLLEYLNSKGLSNLPIQRVFGGNNWANNSTKFEYFVDEGHIQLSFFNNGNPQFAIWLKALIDFELGDEVLRYAQEKGAPVTQYIKLSMKQGSNNTFEFKHTNTQNSLTAARNDMNWMLEKTCTKDN